jgi:hypothetical protein
MNRFQVLLSTQLAPLQLGVPQTAKKQDLEIEILTNSFRVASIDGTVYLEGVLEKGIVPEESAWVHSGGTGEDGWACHIMLATSSSTL